MKARRKLRESRSHAVVWLLLAALLFIGYLGYLVYRGSLDLVDSWTQDLPNPEGITSADYAEESYMYAADGTTLLAKFQLEKRDPVELADISPLVIDATIAVEDMRFYEHDGIDPVGIARALAHNLAGGSLEGASTITQQLVRNTILSEEASDITVERKVREAELALQLENQFSKDEILLMYLNTINYGDGCYGIEAAAQNYFQVSAADLSLTQTATLVGIPQSPNRLNPKLHPEACLERRNTVLSRMLSAQSITQEDFDAAIKEPLGLSLAPDEPEQGIYAYPYFTSFVRDQLLETDNPYGCSYAQLFEGGLRIYTTLDPYTQDCAEAACADQYAVMANNLDAALVAMDPKTGFVKALVGGRNFYTDQWNIAVQGGRPAGSSFKAITLLAAIEHGINPATLIDCTDPVRATDGTEIHNFGSIDYGIRSIQSATAVSSNTGYYRLAEYLTPTTIIEMAHRLGITSELPNYPIITLGTENVTPLEMAVVYNTLASGGIYHEPVVITRIEDKNGRVIYEADTEGQRVVEAQDVGAATKVLRSVFETSEGTAYGRGPANGQPVAGKTGTGSQFRDHWLVGFSPFLTCAAWVGNRDYSSTSESLDAEGLWQNFMSRALANTEVEDFPAMQDPYYSSSYNASQSEKLGGKDMTTRDPETAPSVRGLTVSNALDALEGYAVSIDYVTSSTTTDTVLTQRIADDGTIILEVPQTAHDQDAEE